MLVERAAQALDVKGAIRVDLLVTEGENEYVLEVNTLPGMTRTSLLPKIAAGAGYDFGDLCEAILGRARLYQRRPEDMNGNGPKGPTSDAGGKASAMPAAPPAE